MLPALTPPYLPPFFYTLGGGGGRTTISSGRGMDLNPELRLLAACRDMVQWCSACLSAGCIT